MTQELVFTNGRMVTPGKVMAGSLMARDGQITAIDSSGSYLPGAIDLEGDYLLPGLVELHTDNFERHLMPRPKTRWPELPALLGHDAEVAAAGITTVYDALGVGDTDTEGMRGQDMAPVLQAIRHGIECKLLRADHRLHIRCELPAANVLELFASFEDHPLVGLISLMDHTPGQRQWMDVNQARIYYTGKKGWSDERFDQAVVSSRDLQERYAVPHRRHFVDYAHRKQIPLASHDDTMRHHVAEAHSEGVVISEFPTRVEAAESARAAGMSIVMGAPNVVRGGSHSGNVSAMQLAKLGLLDSLSSDYVPASLMLAAFKLVYDGGFEVPQAIATVTSNPARAVGLTDRGEIAEGLRADLVRVHLADMQPVVRAVWRAGVRVV